MNRKILFVILLMGVVFTMSVMACTTLIVTKGASLDGSMFVGHSDDDHFMDQRIVYVPAKDHPAGSKRKVYATAAAVGEFPQFNTFFYPRLVDGFRAPAYDSNEYPLTIPLGEIPQVAHTYAYFDGNYGIMNEHQLMFGECTNGSKATLDPLPGVRLFYSSELSRVALERCQTAREAVELMGQLIDTYGYYGTGETLPVADPNEAWVFEMAPSPDGTGGLWVAKKIPDGEIFVSGNIFRIREVDPDDPDMLYSENLHTVAEKHGWWSPEDGLLDWLPTVSLGEYNHPYYSLRRIWRLFDKVAPSLGLSATVEDGLTKAYPFSVKPDEKLSLQDVFSLFRDHYEGTKFDLTQGVGAGPFGNPNRYYGAYDGQGDVGDPSKKLEGAWERPISVNYCGYVFVNQGRSHLPDPIGGVMWMGLDKPSDTCFIPFYVGANGLPSIIETYDPLDFDHNSAWWAFNFVANWAEKKYAYMHPEIAARQSYHEEASIQLIQQTDQEALTLMDKNRDALGDYLRQICSKNAETIVSDWWELSEYLIVKYNDGYISTPGNAAQPVGYPREWLNRTEWINGPVKY